MPLYKTKFEVRLRKNGRSQISPLQNITLLWCANNHPLGEVLIPDILALTHSLTYLHIILLTYIHSLQVIEQRIASIKQQLAEAEGDAGKEKLEKELNDLNQLLPDITSKVWSCQTHGTGWAPHNIFSSYGH